VLTLLFSETAAKQVNDWGARLERDLQEIGSIHEEQLQIVDGGVLGKLDNKMLEKLGHQLVSSSTWQCFSTTLVPRAMVLIVA
jgi:hypothetical protein